MTEQTHPDELIALAERVERYRTFNFSQTQSPEGYALLGEVAAALRAHAKESV
jgi:hypothetical protein